MKIKGFIFLIIGWIAISGCDLHQDMHYSEGETVVSMFHSNRVDSTWTENYIYNEKNHLVRVDGLFRNRRYTLIEYNGKDEILQILQYRKEGDELLFRDSLIYDNSDLPVKNHHYSINNEMELTRIERFSYDVNENISSIEMFSVPAEQIKTEKYEWKDGNIVNLKRFDEEWTLLYEYNYQYDNMRNYKQELPHEFSNHLRRTRNNVIWYQYVYHSGPILDLVCNPCMNEYRYNKTGLPVAVKTSYGHKTNIEYR